MSVKTQIVEEYGQHIGTDAYTLDGKRERRNVEDDFCPKCGADMREGGERE